MTKEAERRSSRAVTDHKNRDKQELVKQQPSEITSIETEGFAGVDKLPGSIPRYKINHGEGYFYHSLGEQHKKKLVVNALMGKAVRAHWKEDSEIPLCTSEDCITGVEVTTGEETSCAACLFAKFGSDSKGGKGQDCKQSFLLMAVEENDMRPFVVAFTVTSLKNIGEYFSRLSYQRKQPFNTQTILTLKEKTKPGQVWQVIELEIGKDESEERVAEIQGLIANYKSVWADVRVEKDEQVGEDKPSSGDYKKAFDGDEVTTQGDIPF